MPDAHLAHERWCASDEGPSVSRCKLLFAFDIAQQLRRKAPFLGRERRFVLHSLLPLPRHVVADIEEEACIERWVLKAEASVALYARAIEDVSPSHEAALGPRDRLRFCVHRAALVHAALAPGRAQRSVEPQALLADLLSGLFTHALDPDRLRVRRRHAIICRERNALLHALRHRRHFQLHGDQAKRAPALHGHLLHLGGHGRLMQQLIPTNAAYAMRIRPMTAYKTAMMSGAAMP